MIPCQPGVVHRRRWNSCRDALASTWVGCIRVQQFFCQAVWKVGWTWMVDWMNFLDLNNLEFAQSKEMKVPLFDLEPFRYDPDGVWYGLYYGRTMENILEHRKFITFPLFSPFLKLFIYYLLYTCSHSDIPRHVANFQDPSWGSEAFLRLPMDAMPSGRLLPLVRFIQRPLPAAGKEAPPHTCVEEGSKVKIHLDWSNISFRGISRTWSLLVQEQVDDAGCLRTALW